MIKKRWRRSYVLTGITSFVLLCALAGCTTEKKADLYVATNGEDTNPGTEAKPFASLARAEDAVRDLKSRTQEPITVWVRGGTYYLPEPLVFEPEDSGSENQPITYAAYPGEKPAISGGRKIVAEWRPFRDGIMMCSLEEVKSGEFYFTQLFVNGKRQIRARYPNFDPREVGDQAGLVERARFDPEIALNRSSYILAAGADRWPHEEFYYDPKTFTQQRWSKPHEAVVHIFPANYWGNLQWQVRDIDWDRHAVKLGKGGWHLRPSPGATGLSDRSLFYIENVFEELDVAGEWYLDTGEGILYYRSPSDLDLSTASVEAVVLKRTVEFRGSKERPVRHLKLAGFRFIHTATTFLEEYEVPSMGDWSIHRGGAIFFEGAEDCGIENSFFDAVGGNAVFISGHNRRIRVHGNTFTQSGDSAVCLVGKSHLRTDLSYTCEFCGYKHAWGWGEPTGEYPAECVISNNLIHDIGVFGKQTAGVFVSLSMKNTVSHNHIYNVPRAAICINDGAWAGTLSNITTFTTRFVRPRITAPLTRGGGSHIGAAISPTARPHTQQAT